METAPRPPPPGETPTKPLAEPAGRKPALADLQAYASAFNSSPILADLGCQLSFPSTELVVVEMRQIKPKHRGGLGTDAVNGGILAALFDLAIGCTSALVDPTRRTATVQLSMNFEKAVRGDSLRVEAELSNAGGKMAFATARILDERGQVCARGQGVVRLSNLPWQNTYGGVGAP